jgi:dolichol-phosphate mannosyltransferase
MKIINNKIKLVKKKISLLIPIYNEVQNIEDIYSKSRSLFENKLIQYDYEILLLDNNSNDGSVDVCKKIISDNSKVSYYKLSRNFGFQANILMGYYNCTGDCAIAIDADGQDDPEIINKFVELWEEGNDVVYGIRGRREEGLIIYLCRKIFYRILNTFSQIEIPVDAGDFRLIDRNIINLLKQFKEKKVFLRGIIAYLGFKQIGIKYNRKKRKKGFSKFSVLSYFDFAEEGLISFTKAPLKIITYTGFVLFILSIIGIIIYLILFIKGAIVAPGFTSMILIMLLFFGLLIFFLGITAMYVGLILDEVKSRPSFILDETKSRPSFILDDK